MNYLLSERHRGILSRFTAPGTLLALDFDGTLAPIVDERGRAHLRPRTRRLLRRAAAVFPTAVISGRARDDVRRRVAGMGIREVVGNHGLEPWFATSAHERRAASWRTALEVRLAGHPGVAIEDKRFSLAVHYREAFHRGARANILAALADLRGLRVVPGKRVLNLLPARGAHKGDALRRLQTLLGCTAAVYVGDDETDESVFALGPRDDLLTVRVGRRRESRASFYLRDQEEVDRLLTELLRLRARAAPRQSGSQARLGSSSSS